MARTLDNDRNTLQFHQEPQATHASPSDAHQIDLTPSDAYANMAEAVQNLRTEGESVDLIDAGNQQTLLRWQQGSRTFIDPAGSLTTEKRNTIFIAGDGKRIQNISELAGRCQSPDHTSPTEALVSELYMCPQCGSLFCRRHIRDDEGEFYCSPCAKSRARKRIFRWFRSLFIEE